MTKTITGKTFTQIKLEQEVRRLLKQNTRPYTITEIATKLKVSRDEVIMAIRALYIEDERIVNEYFNLIGRKLKDRNCLPNE